MRTGDEAFRVDGQCVVVTGASSGIGRAVALELAHAGADVVVHANRSVDAANETAEAIRALGRRSEVVLADLSDEESLETLVDSAWKSHGSVDSWINNAGADVLTGSGPDLSFEQKLELLYRVDVRSTLVLSRAVGARMRARGTGSILNIGWDQAFHGMEGESGEYFSATKGAIMCFSKSLALSLAPEVRVNCIAPGWIRTAWGETASDYWQDRVRTETPLGRWGAPEDIARLARFLCSPASAYLTGQVFNANGGANR
ncbi:MAG: SDR family oxidoreductase [Planctomycetota bacterium]